MHARADRRDFRALDDAEFVELLASVCRDRDTDVLDALLALLRGDDHLFQELGYGRCRGYGEQRDAHERAVEETTINHGKPPFPTVTKSATELFNMAYKSRILQGMYRRVHFRTVPVPQLAESFRRLMLVPSPNTHSSA